MGHIIFFILYQNVEIKIVRAITYGRGDSMIWDFVGRRPLPVMDYVVSIKGGPKL